MVRDRRAALMTAFCATTAAGGGAAAVQLRVQAEDAAVGGDVDLDRTITAVIPCA